MKRLNSRETILLYADYTVGKETVPTFFSHRSQVHFRVQTSTQNPGGISPSWGMLVSIIASVCLGAGCAGYQIGPQGLYAPHIRTVYVPVFESDSFRRHLGERLTEAVMKQIEMQTPYKVVGTPDADSTLLGRIVTDTKHLVVENRWDEPRQLDYRLQVEVRWVDHRGTLLGETKTTLPADETFLLTGSAILAAELGHSVAVSQQKAIERLARQIVGMMEAPW